MTYEKKIKVKCPLPWSHHHSGWPFCVNALRRNFHNEEGTPVYTNGVLQEIIQSKKTHQKEWIGFIHATPDEKIKNDLGSTSCLESLKKCRGIFTLSNYVKNFIEQNTNKIMVECILLALDKPKYFFNFNSYKTNKNKKIIMAGHWLRDFETFYQFKSFNHKKTILQCTNKKHPRELLCIPYLESNEFEKQFIENIMFLCLKDASANNFIVECILRNTPILVNKLPATIEYLGKEYPLFYNELKEAEEKIRDLDLIEKSHNYLLKLNKKSFTEDGFVKNFYESKIYQSIKLKHILI